jgi:hypothetical protein
MSAKISMGDALFTLAFGALLSLGGPMVVGYLGHKNYWFYRDQMSPAPIVVTFEEAVCYAGLLTFLWGLVKLAFLLHRKIRQVSRHRTGAADTRKALLWKSKSLT